MSTRLTRFRFFSSGAEARRMYSAFSDAGIFRGPRSVEEVLRIGVRALAEGAYEGLEHVCLVHNVTTVGDDGLTPCARARGRRKPLCQLTCVGAREGGGHVFDQDRTSQLVLDVCSSHAPFPSTAEYVRNPEYVPPPVSALLPTAEIHCHR